MNKTQRCLTDFSFNSAAKEIKNVEFYRDSFERGFFIYFSKNKNKVAPSVAKWKIGYYREMYHNIEEPAVYYLRIWQRWLQKYQNKVPKY